MPSICLYFQVHQPLRIREYTFFDIGERHDYFHDELNLEVLNKVSDKCYLKANAILLETLQKMGGKFKVAFSFSGLVLEQLEAHRTDVLDSFRKLVDTGCVEILAETYYHSLAFVFSKPEFERQVKMHSEKVEKLFGQKPRVFRNTELIYSNELAQYVSKMGYAGILAEGSEAVLRGNSPNFLHKAVDANKIKVLTKNYSLSDDVAFRFSDKNWSEYPLTASRYANRIHRYADEADVINLFMDYETFGEHQWEETGIFELLKSFPEKLLRHLDFDFKTPSEVVKKYEAKDTYDCQDYSSWADTERDISTWLGNTMQRDATNKLYEWEKAVIGSGNNELISLWGKMQCSDHFYYMSTKGKSDGAVHGYFSPFRSPYDAYLHYMNIISDLEMQYFAVVADGK
jgi:alpha-amylase